MVLSSLCFESLFLERKEMKRFITFVLPFVAVSMFALSNFATADDEVEKKAGGCPHAAQKAEKGGCPYAAEG